MNIDEIRKQYPEYDDLSDRQIAEGLHKKDYSDMDFNVFADRIGYNPDKDQARVNFKNAPSSPDKEADNQRVADKLGIPSRVVGVHPEQYKLQAEAPDFDGLAASHPSTLKYLADPANTAISRDDHQALSQVESIIHPPVAARLIPRTIYNLGQAGNNFTAWGAGLLDETAAALRS